MADLRSERSTGWNHNVHYHPVILRSLPAGCGKVLDVGCGEGALALDLSRVVQRVTAIELDAPTIEGARRGASAENIDYVLGDFMSHEFEPESFDAVVSVAALHHMDAGSALERMRMLVRAGGVVSVVGLARSRYPRDLPFEIVGAIATRVRRLWGPYREINAPTVWPPPDTYLTARRVAEHVLPGVRFRRHIYWRYSLIWQKGPPCADPASG